MRRIGPWLAAALVVLANGWIAVVGTLGGLVNHEVVAVLTERELPVVDRSATPGGGGALALQLRFREPPAGSVLDRATLERLGFDCGVPAADPRAERHYARQLPRPGYAVLAIEEAGAQPEESRLVVVDAGPDADALLRRHPPVSGHLVLPAIFAVSANGEEDVVGRVLRLARRELHVPARLASRLRAPSDRDVSGPARPRHDVVLGFGRDGGLRILDVRPSAPAGDTMTPAGDPGPEPGCAPAPDP